MLFAEEITNDNKVIGQIFNNTVATYKYYWFVSILDIVVKEGKKMTEQNHADNREN